MLQSITQVGVGGAGMTRLKGLRTLKSPENPRTFLGFPRKSQFRSVKYYPYPCLPVLQQLKLDI